MNSLKTINFDKQTVSARELHEALDVEKRFSAWFETNSQGFIEGEDYTSVLKSTEVQNNGGIQLRELQDFECSIDMAKHICLMSRTSKGKEVRQYLIDLEKAWNTPELVMARALKVADRTIDGLKIENKQLKKENELMKPKALFADCVSASDSTILVGELAKILKGKGVDIGQNRLFSWMRDNGYLVKRQGTDYNMPTQRAMEKGLFKIKETAINKPDGSVKISKTVKVTGKGQQYFINKILRTA